MNANVVFDRKSITQVLNIFLRNYVKISTSYINIDVNKSYRLNHSKILEQLSLQQLRNDMIIDFKKILITRIELIANNIEKLSRFFQYKAKNEYE